MRYVASLVIVLALLVGAWFVKGSSVFTSGYRPPASPPATVGTWVNIGPAPLSYIDNPAEPANWNSGRVATLAVDPLNTNHWLMGAGNGGVWESFDGGTSWLPITDAAPRLRRERSPSPRAIRKSSTSEREKLRAASGSCRSALGC